MLGEPPTRALRERKLHVLLDQLRAHLRDELVNDALDGLERERREGDPGVEAVAELRAEGALDCAAALPLREAGLVLLESYLRVRHLARARVRRHYQDDVVEVRALAVVVGQGGVIHHLKEYVEEVRVRLLDLVEDDDGVGRLVDGVCEKPALVEADVAGRRTDEARDRVRLGVLAHVEAQELDAEGERELLGEFRLADSGRAGEEERADGLVGLAEAGARELDGVRHLRDGVILPEDR